MQSATPTFTPVNPVLEAGALMSHLVDAIGKAVFPTALLEACNTAYGVDHCSIFKLSNYRLQELASATLRDAERLQPTLLGTYDVRRHLSQVGSTLARVDVQVAALAGPRVSPQRVLISCQRGN